jgi:hypothetical protein
MLITIYTNCYCGPTIGCIYAAAYSLTLQELLTAFDAYVTVHRLITQDVVTVRKILARLCNCERNFRICFTIREHPFIFTCYFVFHYLNFCSFSLLGNDSKPTAGTTVDRVYEIVLDSTWSDNKVRELVTVCLPWQHWTKALVWFDDVDISAFHSFVVVDLWQSLSK